MIESLYDHFLVLVVALYAIEFVILLSNQYKS